MGEGKKRKLKRIAIYSICEIFEYIDASPTNGQQIDFYGDKIHLRSSKLLNFRIHGITCVKCGMKGGFFAKERWGKDPFHINLYGFGIYGNPVLITQDHIKPRAKGGTNNLYNLQTMCKKCNSRKGSNWDIKDKIKYFSRKILCFVRKEYK